MHTCMPLRLAGYPPKIVYWMLYISIDIDMYVYGYKYILIYRYTSPGARHIERSKIYLINAIYKDAK